MIDQFAEYGLKSPQIPQDLIKAFFQYWWGTPLDSKNRSKVKFTVLQGPLVGHGVGIVESEGALFVWDALRANRQLLCMLAADCPCFSCWHLFKGACTHLLATHHHHHHHNNMHSRPGCADHSPAIAASHRGSQLFIYHAKAVSAFRKTVLTPWFVKYAQSKGKSIDQVGG